MEGADLFGVAVNVSRIQMFCDFRLSSHMCAAIKPFEGPFLASLSRRPTVSGHVAFVLDFSRALPQDPVLVLFWHHHRRVPQSAVNEPAFRLYHVLCR